MIGPIIFFNIASDVLSQFFLVKTSNEEEETIISYVRHDNVWISDVIFSKKFKFYLLIMT